MAYEVLLEIDLQSEEWANYDVILEADRELPKPIEYFTDQHQHYKPGEITKIRVVKIPKIREAQ